MINIRLIIALAFIIQPTSAFARNILLTNDDGLSSNVEALYEALKAQGHDVIVSVPCSNQSGMGAAIKFLQPIGALSADCRNGAAKAGGPGVGPMTKVGFEQDYFYVDGTPVMATLYGIDIAAAARWGKAPDLVISGPNEGRNTGQIVISSGTVSNAQYAASRLIPAIAFSAGIDTTGDDRSANPKSDEIADLSARLVQFLDDNAQGQTILPAGVALNVNFPDELGGARWKLTRIGTYNAYNIRFVRDMGDAPKALTFGLKPQHGPGIIIEQNTDMPSAEQKDDESAVVKRDIAVSVMQVGYDHELNIRDWAARHLRGLLDK